VQVDDPADAGAGPASASGMDTGGRRAQQREPVQYGRRAVADHRTRAEAGVRGVYGETVGQDGIPGDILDDVRTWPHCADPATPPEQPQLVIADA
jgi:hypothetical protein